MTAQIAQIKIDEKRVRVWSTFGYEGSVAITKEGHLSTRLTYDRMALDQKGWLGRIESAVRERFEAQGRYQP